MVEGIARGDAVQASDLSTYSWAVRAPVPEPHCNPVCVQLAGCLCPRVLTHTLIRSVLENMHALGSTAR